MSLPATRAASATLYQSVMSGIAAFLATLPEEAWNAATDCAGWSVRDLAGHLAGAQQDILSVRTTLRHRRDGRRRYPRLSPLDAANQVQVDEHAGLSAAELAARYAANAPKVAGKVGSLSAALAWIPVQRGMAPGGAALRLGYLFNVIYLRDAWMHGIDLARATGRPRPAADADGPVLEQIMRDTAQEWVSVRCPGPAVQGPAPGLVLELTGDLHGEWHLGGEGPQTRVSGVGLDFVRRLSGRKPELGLRCVAGDQAAADRLSALRILF